MKKIILLLIVIRSALVFSQTEKNLILSEVMFNPAEANGEFIELYNLGDTESIDLNRFKIVYYSSKPDSLVPVKGTALLPPHSYAVIFEKRYDLDSGAYGAAVPAGTIIMKTSDNSFGTSGMSNSSDRPVTLISPGGDTVDTYYYSADNQKGFSDERILLSKKVSGINWSNGKNINGTPGFKNSVSPFDYDLSLTNLELSVQLPEAGGSIEFYASVKNSGLKSAGNFKILFYDDENLDSSAESSELIGEKTFTGLSPGDSVTASLSAPVSRAGEHAVIAEIYFEADEDLSNNLLRKVFIARPPPPEFNSVVINEIMYAPSSGGPEWIELRNNTQQPVNIKKWSLSDNSTESLLTDSDIYIAGNSFLVISKDSSIKNIFKNNFQFLVAGFPSLNNTGDAVVIKDSLGYLIDSLYYSPSWGGDNGKSLERKDPLSQSVESANWQTSQSIFGATPGYINSVTVKDYDVLLERISSSPSLPLFGDDVNVNIELKNTGKKESIADLYLYEDTDRDSIPDILIAQKENIPLQAGDSASILIYVFRNIDSEKFLIAKAVNETDQDTTNNKSFGSIVPGYPPGTVKINEIMYSPSPGEPEWIELINTSGEKINLNGWEINDVYTTPTSVYINNDIFINAKSYLVVSRDSSLLNSYRIMPEYLAVTNLPSLNNSGDGVVLKDKRLITIDSVLYQREWGGTNGYSLERRSADAQSNIASNWSSSRDIEQATPGRINSISPRRSDLQLDEIYFSPRYPAGGEDIKFSAEIRNNGSEPAEDFSVSFFTRSPNSQYVYAGEQKVTYLDAYDSLSVECPAVIKNLKEKTFVSAKIFYAPDEDTLNNAREGYIEPGFGKQSIIINEVMYAPENGEPEWVELFNRTQDTINIINWSIGDVLPEASKYFLSVSDFFILPGEYVIISRDSSFLNYHHTNNLKLLVSDFGNLGNVKDGVVIYDFRGAVIDSLLYSSSWGGSNGRSLERLSSIAGTNDSTNWLSSLDRNKSTPGGVNSVSLVQGYNANDLVINEIMYEPDDAGCEFVEVYNRSGSIVNLGGFYIEEEGANSYQLSGSNFNLQPGEYFVLGSDSSLITRYSLDNEINLKVMTSAKMSLSNSGELLLLKDIKGNVIDSIRYYASWHNKNNIVTRGISLERINPDMPGNSGNNWSSSAAPDGATPGQKNSIFTLNNESASGISVSPNPFSPDNDGFEDFTVINYNLHQSTAQVRIRIYDSRGRLVRTLLNNSPSGHAGSIIFDGRNDSGSALRIGIYIILLEALNENAGVLEVYKKALVIARKLN